MNFSNTFSSLGDSFYEKIDPDPVRDPKLFLWNESLAEELIIPDKLKKDGRALAEIFSGNRILPGSEPLATAYAGHQFGYFVPQLGDGRAHLLGELIGLSGRRWDIQLKGSGPTRFSRDGDGRCALGPAIREFIMSEAMHALGVPTSRCLTVVTTGESVFRETALPGAVVTRIASSHIRIGTFQFFADRGDYESLKRLFDYTLARHYPEIEDVSPGRYLAFLDSVMERLIRLVVEWMRVGFIHGVMNTDNCSLSGETIDYGPCAMMGRYDPLTCYSSIDQNGRYAFGRQPTVMHWNITRLAESLLPLIDSDQKKAIEAIGPILEQFPKRFEGAYMEMMGEKLGLSHLKAEDHELVLSILERMKERQMDYTITFHHLGSSLISIEDSGRKSVGDFGELKNELGSLYERWRERLRAKEPGLKEAIKLMGKNNPVVIPRNHHMEAVIKECVQKGSSVPAVEFLKVLRSPYEELEETVCYQDPPTDGDEGYKTFCGT